MDIVKKNFLSILCGVVALGAIIAFFVLVSGERAALRQGLQERKALYADLENIRGKPRSLPVFKDDDPTGGLGVFPNAEIIKAGEAARTKVQAEAAKAMEAAVLINRHEPLVASALTGRRDLDRLDFQQRYIQKLDLHPRRKGDPRSIQRSILKAGRPPTPADEVARAEFLWNTEFAPKIRTWGQQTDEPLLRKQLAERRLTLLQEMRDEVANNSMVYLEPTALDFNQRMLNPEPAPPVEIWWAQLGLWVQEDIAKAIARANRGAANVKEAPVKRLIQLVQPKGFVIGEASRPGTPVGSPMDPGSEMAFCEDDPFGTDPIEESAMEFRAPSSISFTERTANDLYDVVHYSLVMDVETAKLPQVLAELSRDQFIYVLQVNNVRSVDSVAMKARNYLYGERPVCEVTIQIEQIFLRPWTVPLMPREIRTQLGIAGPPSAAATATQF